MKNFIKNFSILIIVTWVFILMLSHGTDTKTYGLLGLNIWYQHMVPALFPFMVLSGLFINLKLDTILILPFRNILKPIFKISDGGIYTLFMGFLCGFPMGAKIAAMEYREGKISLKEAEYLLCFCNNFGPAYYFSFIYQNIYPKEFLLRGLFLLYGIPLLYGIFLRYTLYRKENFYFADTDQESVKNLLFQPFFKGKQTFSYINGNIVKALVQIGVLGGYMIFCNMLMGPLKPLIENISIFFQTTDTRGLLCMLHSMLEISGGILAIKQLPLSDVLSFGICHMALCFNGLSCHLQTLHMLENCPVSGKKYMLHKLNLCSITCLVLFILMKLR